MIARLVRFASAPFWMPLLTLDHFCSRRTGPAASRSLWRKLADALAEGNA